MPLDLSTLDFEAIGEYYAKLMNNNKGPIRIGECWAETMWEFGIEGDDCNKIRKILAALKLPYTTYL